MLSAPTSIENHFNGYELHPFFKQLIPQARLNVEKLLTSLEVAEYSFFAGKKVERMTIVNKSHQSILGLGDSAVVFELPEVNGVPLLVKFNTYGNRDREEFPNHWFLPGYSVYDLWGDWDGIKVTVKELKALNFNYIPFQAQFRTDGNKAHPHVYYPLAYHICFDLREGGKYSVFEAAEMPKSINNYKELIVNYEHAVKMLYKAVGGGEARYTGVETHKLRPAGHINEAIERMFFVRVNKSNIGELVAGDLDHLIISKSDSSEFDSSEFELVQ